PPRPPRKVVSVRKTVFPHVAESVARGDIDPGSPGRSWRLGGSDLAVQVSSCAPCLRGSIAVMRIALGIEYDGSDFCGWQTQPSGRAVQDAVDSALAQIAAHPVQSQCAGRTDAGVHALGQVIHFE